MKKLAFAERITYCHNPCGQQLLKIIAEKQTNLAISIDLTDAEQILSVIDAIGAELCLVKTHVDIIGNYTKDFARQLLQLSCKHQFLIFEDRKFADIGHTAKMQYEGGVYQIADWAHIVNAHSLPGPGLIEGLRSAVADRDDRGLLMLASMSSQGGLFTSEYTEQTVQMAQHYKDFVMGYISQSCVDPDPGMLHITPGVKLEVSGDGLGQQYRTPRQAIVDDGCDIIIVGRGIISHANPLEITKKYRKYAWQAYQECV